MKTRTKHMLIGGGLGAIGLAAAYELYRHRAEIAAPLGVPMAHREHEHRKHEHERHEKHENDRGEYGKKHHHHHEEDS